MTLSPNQPPRARSYAWRLMLLAPALAMLGVGYWRYTDLPPGGTIQRVALTTRSDLAGQVRDAYASVEPGTPDLYLVVKKSDGSELTTQVYKDTPLGNGLTWTLPTPLALGEMVEVAVWDSNALMPDKQLDRIAVAGWSAVGQTFKLDLQGQHPLPPDWALPLAAVGGTLLVVVLLRFVWDQAM